MLLLLTSRFSLLTIPRASPGGCSYFLHLASHFLPFLGRALEDALTSYISLLTSYHSSGEPWRMLLLLTSHFSLLTIPRASPGGCSYFLHLASHFLPFLGR